LDGNDMAQKKTILFIDDNPVDRTLISRLLVKYDFNVLLAEDGPVGLRVAQENKLDLILLDILLPGISGIELCKKFKKNVNTQDVPVIFYTSIDTPKHLIDYASYGARDYIQKITPPEELIASIKAVLQ
jgi:DNA-binding response OmpR family regulator